MEKEREDKILEAIGRQREDIIAHMDNQFGSVIKKLEKHDEQFEKISSRFDRIETAVLESSKNIKDNGIKIDRVEGKLDTAITNHEGRIRIALLQSGV